jgi:hypothetical protein
MEKLDAKAQLSPLLGSQVGWTPRIARDPKTLIAWTYALGCGEAQVAQGMLKLLGAAGVERSLHLPASFEDHLEMEMRHAEWLHEEVRSQREELEQEPAYRSIEGVMSQAMESYARSLLGFSERQTLCQEAQYCTATLALGSRIFRHFTELGRECGDLKLSLILSKIVEEEARYARTAQILLQELPGETHGIYRSVRSFEEMLFGRMIRKLTKGLDFYERCASKQAADLSQNISENFSKNRSGLARCV